jgi:hypothetical protein
MITLTKAEQNALGLRNTPKWTHGVVELSELTTQSWVVWDDAPMPYWKREKVMKVLENLAVRIGYPIPYLPYV